MTVMKAPTSMGLVAALDKHDVVLLPPLILRDTIRGKTLVLSGVIMINTFFF